MHLTMTRKKPKDTGRSRTLTPDDLDEIAGGLETIAGKIAAHAEALRMGGSEDGVRFDGAGAFERGNSVYKGWLHSLRKAVDLKLDVL